jgi:hypothetical protein
MKPSTFLMVVGCWIIFVGGCSYFYDLGKHRADAHWKENRFEGIRSCEGGYTTIMGAADSLPKDGGTVYAAQCGGVMFFVTGDSAVEGKGAATFGPHPLVPIPPVWRKLNP